MMEGTFFQCLVAAGMSTDWSDRSVVGPKMNKKDYGECEQCLIFHVQIGGALVGGDTCLLLLGMTVSGTTTAT
jgi:hypothetical protein